MKIFWRVFLLILLMASFSLWARDWHNVCRGFPAPLKGKYCVHVADGSQNQDVLYYFHGSGNSEMTWQQDTFYSELIRQYWDEFEIDPPIIVSLSFGPQWLLAENRLLPLVTQKMIPFIEKEMGGLKGRRMVLGDSMGGFNASVVMFKTKLFERVAMLCAPMFDGIGLYSSASEIQQYLAQTMVWKIYGKESQHIITESVKGIIDLGKVFYPTAQEWQAHDPIELAQYYIPQEKDSLYLNAGVYDQYALFEGNQRLYQILSDNGLTVDWHPTWGGHCALDVPSLAEFITK